MFGFLGGQSAEAVARKKGYMESAKRKWPFLTTIDCRPLKNIDQFLALIKVRAGLTDEQAKSDVYGWAEGMDFSSVYAKPARHSGSVK